MPSALPISPLSVDSQCLCLSLRRAARVVSRRYDEALCPLELNIGQFSLLTAIAGMQPVAMQALADHLAMDRTTLTAALKPLQRRGLIEIEASGVDARSRIARLWRRGAGLLRRAMPLWQAAQRREVDAIGAAESSRLRRRLGALV